MDIHLRPALEEQVRQDVQRGPHQTVDEFIERAVCELHEQEVWLSSHRAEIAKKIEEGWLAAECGELIGDEKVKTRMLARKKEICHYSKTTE